MTTVFLPRPTDATLSVTKAARLLGVHPNTIRTWSDAGRLRYFRINSRGDRRYRLGDLQRFLSSAETARVPGTTSGRGVAAGRRVARDCRVDGLAMPISPPSRPLKKAHLLRWRARAALRRTDRVRLAPRLARRLASGPF